MSVLLVDADDRGAGLLRERLRDLGLDEMVRLTRAGSLATARELLASTTFDAALIDLALPDGAGLDAYRRFTELAPDLPVVVLSHENDHALAVAAVREGAQDYLVTGRLSGEAIGRVLRYAVERGRLLARERAALRQEREASEQLRRFDEMKDTFLQAVSHELRTPLASVYGYAMTLRDSRDRLSEAQRDLVIDRLAVNAERLRRLLDDLLDVNRLSNGTVPLRPEPVDVAALVAQVVQHADMPHHRLRTDLQPVRIEAEPARVERMVANLLRNAIKHTPPGTTVWLSTEPVEQGALLTVADDGPGVEDDLKPEVFTAFRQGRGTREAANPGTGIGLNLVARFAELHGGRAWVEDRPGGGARFRVLLPRDREAGDVRD